MLADLLIFWWQRVNILNRISGQFNAHPSSSICLFYKNIFLRTRGSNFAEIKNKLRTNEAWNLKKEQISIGAEKIMLSLFYFQSLSVDWKYWSRTGGKNYEEVCMCVCVSVCLCVCVWTAWGLNYLADLAQILVTESWQHVVVCVLFLSLHHAWVTSQPPCCNSWGGTVAPSVLIWLTCGLQYRSI